MSRVRIGTGWFVFLTQVVVIAALVVGSSQSAVAADDNDPPSRVARLSYLRGPVSFQPAGESEWVGAIANRPLTTGDRLWTDKGARAELSTGSATIRLDAGTDFSFLNLDDRIVQMQITQGTVTVRVQRLRQDELVEVDTPNQAFSILRPGSYRVEASEDGYSTLVTVRAGEGETYGGGETYAIHSGQSTKFTGIDHLRAVVLQEGRFDELDEWGQSRDRRSDDSPSARYVSHEVVGYEDLDENGTWRTDPNYGHVWMPTRVASGWAPYHDGHWAWISPWGYTWVDDAPWGYAPFHYGRWVTVEGRWGWVPGPIAVEAVYAPALVAFIGGPSFGLSISVGGGGSRAEVGWFPLGPREVYVPGYHVSRGYVERVNVSNTTVNSTTITNVYNTQVTNEYRTTNIQYVNRTARGGVTVVPQQAFTSAQPVARAAVTINQQRIASAPVGPTAAAVPTRHSVFGASVSRTEGTPRPPPAVANRSVVAKAPPPPPPVPFARQQPALELHPGQPLARHEIEKVRPPDAAQKERSPQAGTGQPARAALPATVPNSPKPSTKPSTPPKRPLVGESVRPPTAPTLPRPEARPAQPPQPPVPSKPAVVTVQPPVAPKPAVHTAEPAKTPERVVKPPQPPVPSKSAEQTAQPPGPRKPAVVTVQSPVAPKPVVHTAEPAKAPAGVAQQRRPPTPAAGAVPRKTTPQDEKKKLDEQLPPAEEMR